MFTSFFPLSPIPAFILHSAIIFAAALNWAESLLCHPLWAKQVKVLPSSDWLLLLPAGTQWMLAGQRVVWVYWGRDAQTEWSDPTPTGKQGLKSCCSLLGNFSKCVLRQFFNYLVSPFPLFWSLAAWEQSLRNSLLLVLILSTPALFCQELLGYNSVILPWQPWFFSQAIFTVWPPSTMVTVQQERQHCVSLKEGTC